MTHSPTTHQPSRAIDLRITNPDSCGEDLVDNLRRVFTFAPTHCAGCADYHIVNALKRLTGQTGWSGGTRQVLLEALQPILADLAEHDSDPIDVLIAACADTGVLATCAHAFSTTDEALSARARFTVIDRCPTPLMLCETFRERHGFAVHTDIVDLLDTTQSFAADVVILHNLLVFVPEAQHEDLLRTLAGWLKPGGRVVIWQPLVQPRSRTDYRSKRAKRFDRMIEMIEDGSIEIGEPLETLRQRIERNIDDFLPGRPRTANARSLIEIIEAAGLVTLSTNEIAFQLGGSSGPVSGMMALVGRP